MDYGLDISEDVDEDIVEAPDDPTDKQGSITISGSVLQGKEPKVGDSVTFKVTEVREDGDEYVLQCQKDSDSPEMGVEAMSAEFD